jgi:serine/threonine-protein kinase
MQGIAATDSDGDPVTGPRSVTRDSSGESELAPESRGSVPPPAKAADPYIGVTIDGRYKIESTLGEGGMGVVYAGRHKVINKRVAIKVLRGELSRDREMVERFLQEARAASSIGHPHIADVSDFGELPDGSAYFVMEFLEGEGLADTLKRDRPLPMKRILNIGKQVADALDAAHAQQIVHRDLKPDNVFLVTKGLEKDYVKILDFGIAKVATSSNTKLTRAGTVFGTPHYMSPEQAAGAPVDHRTDIYALGVILYEAASGKVPFDADNYMGILTQHMYKAPVPIRALVPPVPSDVPPGLEAVILKCLSKKPEQRYSSMRELVDDLEIIEKGGMPTAIQEMIARSGSFNVPADYFNNAQTAMSDMMPATPPRGRARWPLIAGIAGVVAAVGIVTVILSMGRSSPAQTSPDKPGPSAAAPATPPPVAAASVTEPAKPVGKPVVVIASPLDAEVWRGSENLGKVPVTVNVPPGETVTVEVRHDAHVTQALTLDGSKPREEIKLKAEPPKVGGPLPAGKPGDKPAGKPPGKKGGGGDIVDPWAK